MASDERQIGNAGGATLKWGRGLSLLGWAAVAALSVTAFLMIRAWPGVPPAGSGTTAGVSWPAPVVITPEAWAVIHPSPASAARGGGGADSAQARFRLAGTFLVGSGEAVGIEPMRKAILDDLVTHRQNLAAENEQVGDLIVRRIFTDRVLVEWNGRTEELLLAFKDPGANPAAATAGPKEVSPDADAPALEHSRYGKRVGETRWILDRDSLNEYYRGMLDNPERVVKMYDTFKPVYNDQKRIAGYRIGIEGEADFLKAVGLKEGDVVREVNSLKMTSQSRAEFFLGEFAKGRLGAVVLDIEREGKNAKLVYLIR